MGFLSGLLAVTVFETIELFTGGALLAVTVYSAGKSGKSNGGGVKRSRKRTGNRSSQ